jgi:hypothetical protein
MLALLLLNTIIFGVLFNTWKSGEFKHFMVKMTLLLLCVFNAYQTILVFARVSGITQTVKTARR